ncbi:hypothetical protein ANO11243_043260 [Dothideomycetidae sp. 11243]|nr:hypothetical protein ANO11243_043260 [fungal sp. No.11243]
MDRTISNHLNTNKDSAKAVPQDDTSAISNQGHKASELEGLSGTNIGAGGEEVAPSKVLPPQPLGTIRWSQQPEHFPVTSTISLPVGTAKAIPRVQFKFGKEDKGAKKDRIQKLDTIRAVAKKNWQSYQKFAWMHDEVAPVTGGFKDPFGGWAATLVDALDTLFLMGFVKEFEEAIEAVKTIDFTRSVRDDIPLFETVIRYLGGMLGAYDVSGGRYSVLLDKSVELAEILMGAFDTPNRMPVTFYQWKPAFASQPHRAGSSVVMAELGTLSLEFTRLAQLTKEPKYYDAIDRITDAFVEWQTREGNGTTLPGLFPLNVDASGCMKPDPFSSVVSPYGRDRYSLGGMADSTYEYFPKTYLLLGGLEDKYRGLYERSMDTAVKKLIFRPRVPGDHDILISGDYDAWYSSGFFDPSAAVDGQLLPTTGHLACFTGGMFALGSKIFDRPNDLEIATRLTEGCVWAYSITESGVMPEAFDLMACESKSDCTWDETAYAKVLDPNAEMREQIRDEVAKAMIAEQNLPRGVVSISQRKYMLRPEAIESVWYMYRVTGDEHWRKVGWEMWTAVDAATSTTYGNSAIWDVTVNATDKLDSQESFWLAETLKYFFLLFSEEDVISLDEWVLNTEAHPFKRPAPKSKL